MRTYGSVHLVDGEWRFDVEPQVRIRLKRWLPRLEVSPHSAPRVKATPDVAADLEAFLLRYPLEVHPDGEVQRRADAYRERQEATRRVLSGEAPYSAARKLALPPREYQRTAAQLAHTTGGLVLGDELGLGKTVTAIALLAMADTLPALVVVPAHMAIQWERELQRFLPGIRTHIIRKGRPYDIDPRPDVLISTYHKLHGWAGELAGDVRTVVFDECQELRRTDSFKYQGALDIAEGARFRLGLSATPVYNYGGEFWSIAQVIRPDALGSQTEFGREWCNGHYDLTKARLADPKAFGAHIRDIGLFLRRTKREVGRELPPCEQIVHDVDMGASALKAVESRATELAKIILSNAERFARMRAGGELSNALRMATGVDKAPYAAAFVRMLLEEGAGPVVLCGWHREVYGIWAEALSEFNPCWLTGSESPAKKQREVDRFVRGESDLLIMSLRSGAGVDGLQARCSRIVFGELDWSPGVHEQCIGRVFRDGQTEPVFAYFLVGDDGSDPIVVDVLGLKTQQIAGIREPERDVIVDQVDPDHIRKLAEAYLAKAVKA